MISDFDDTSAKTYLADRRADSVGRFPARHFALEPAAYAARTNRLAQRPGRIGVEQADECFP